jgi:alpha-1,3-rhamnosyl/mannosyltransferase
LTWKCQSEKIEGTTYIVRVVLSVDALAPVLTGIGRYSWELTTRLPLFLGSDNVRYIRQRRWVEDPSQLLQPYAPRRRTAPDKFLRRLRINPPLWFTEQRLKRACRGKVFHSPNYFLPSCADIGVVTVHDLSVFKFPETHPVERLRQFEREFGRSIAGAAHLITDSEAIRREVIDFLVWPSEKITAVPLGVSVDFSPKPGKALMACVQKYGLTVDAYTLCVSTLEPRKNIENLLHAYCYLTYALRAQFPLILAGSAGWLRGALHEKMDRYARQGWIRYLGYVPEEDLPALYAGAHLFVLPSYYEGFGLPVLEAMASGVPVVTSNRSSLPEITQGAALLADPDDVDTMARLITKGLCDTTWRSSARSNGLAVAQGYSWQRCVEQTVGVYKGVMS